MALKGFKRIMRTRGVKPAARNAERIFDRLIGFYRENENRFHHTVNRLRPLRRRRLITLRPSEVLMRRRKPCRRLPLILVGVFRCFFIGLSLVRREIERLGTAAVAIPCLLKICVKYITVGVGVKLFMSPRFKESSNIKEKKRLRKISHTRRPPESFLSCNKKFLCYNKFTFGSVSF